MKSILMVQVIMFIMALNFTGCTECVDEIEINDNISISSNQIEDTEQENMTELPQLEENDEYTTEEKIEALEIPEEMLAYWKVLNSKMPFISANEGCQEFFWDEYFWCSSGPDPLYEVFDFGIVDLDNDGSGELVITGFPETTQVLDYQEGRVYGYYVVYRGMKAIDVNGVFNSSSGADIGGFYRIVYFDKGVYEKETLAYMDGNYFEVGGVEVSSDEFYAYTASLNETEMMENMDFTEEMLDKILLGDLDEEILSGMRNMEPEEICDENNPQMADVPEAYLAVLSGKEEFVCVTEEGQKFIIDGTCIRNQVGEEAYQILYFSVVDMDGDGEPEVILTCGQNNLILHAIEGAVCGYLFGFGDEMGAIAKDGVFETRYQHEHTHGKIVSFDNEGCRIENIEEYGNVNDNRIRYYYFSEELMEQ